MKYSYGKKGFGDQLKIEELIRIPGIGVIFPPILANGNIPEMEFNYSFYQNASFRIWFCQVSVLIRAIAFSLLIGWRVS